MDNILYSFLTWKDELYSEIRGSVVMFDIPHYYKWVTETELFKHFMQQ